MDPATITTILSLVVTYGPAAETAIANLYKKLTTTGTVTAADVELEFSGLKPYSDYNIPNAQS